MDEVPIEDPGHILPEDVWAVVKFHAGDPDGEPSVTDPPVEPEVN